MKHLGERDRERDIQIDRQRQRETHRDRDRETQRDTDRDGGGAETDVKGITEGAFGGSYRKPGKLLISYFRDRLTPQLKRRARAFLRTWVGVSTM